MKLHLPAGLLAAVLASLSWSASAADSISINFGTAGTTLAGKEGTAGLIAVGASGWNNAVGGSNTKSDLVNQDGVAINGTVQWTAPQSPWGPSGFSQATLEGAIQSSYLDLSASNQWIVNVSSDFLIADVYVYLSGDNNVYAPVNVNGTAYAGDKDTGTTRLATEADTTNGWGDRSTTASATIAQGTNALVVEGVNGSYMTLSNVPSGTNNRRATLSGIQIVDATDTYVWSREIAGETTWSASEWSNGGGEALQSKTWEAIVADSTLRPIASLAGSGTVRLDTAVTAEAVIARSGSAVVLSGEQLNLTGLATLLAESGATLTLDNSVSALGAVTISGSGQVIANADQAWHGLTGGGTLELAAGKTLALDGTATSSFLGHLILNDASTVTLAASDFSNKIAAEGTGTLTLTMDGKGATFGNATIWGARTGATAAHHAIISNATASNLTVVEGGSGYGSLETTITDTTVTGTLSLGTGTLTATNGFVINVGTGSTIGNVRLTGSGSAVTGDVTLNITGGTLGAGSAGIEAGLFTFVGQDSTLIGNVNLNVSGGSITAANMAFGGFGQKNDHSLVGNVVMKLTGGSVESSIYAGSSWGGRIEGDMSILLTGGTLGKEGANRELSAGCTGNNSWASQSVSGDVNFLLGRGDGYGTSFLGNYSIYAGDAHGTVGGNSTVTLQGVSEHDVENATHGVANFTGVISGGNASGAGVTGKKSLVFDDYQTLAQANFQYFDEATVKNNSHVTLNNAANKGITAWSLEDSSELTVTSSGALGGGSVAIASGARLIYDSGTSTVADTFGNALTGTGAFEKKGSNTLTLNQTATTGSMAVREGSLAVGVMLTTGSMTVDTGASLILGAGAQFSAASLTNMGTIVVAGAVSLDAASAALSGSVEWTGGTLTLGSATQYAATTTTLTSNASYLVLTLTGDATAETTVSFDLGDLVLNGGLLTFSMAGADTSLFSAENFTLTTNSVTGSASVGDSVFLSLNNTVYEGALGQNGSITFSSVNDLPADGSADGSTNYKLNTSTVLSGPTTVNNLFLLPADEAAGLTLTMDAANGLTVNGTLTIEGGTADVNLAGGSTNVQDMKLTSGNLALQDGATLTVNHDLISTGGTLSFEGGTFAYGTGYTGDISSMIAAGGTIRVQTSGNNVTWATALGSPVVKEGAGRLTMTAANLTNGGNFTVNGGELALVVDTAVTTTITADQKLTLAGTTDGKFVKTGSGTWRIAQNANKSQVDSDAFSGSSFEGDIRIESGSLVLGKTSTDGIGANFAVSANALGTKGTVIVADGARFELGITQNGTANFAKNVTLEKGATFHTIDGNYNLNGKVTLAGDATITVDWGKTVSIKNILEGSGKLTLRHGGAAERGYLKLDAQNAADFSGTAFTGGIDVVDNNIDVRFTHTVALGSGGIDLGNTGNALEYQGTGTAYETMANIVSGAGGLKVSSGNLETSAANTYTGATTVTAGSLKVSGSVGSATTANTYSVASGATLVVSGSGSVSNRSVTLAAKPAVTRDVTEGTLSNVTADTTHMTRTSTTGKGTVENGLVNVTADAYTIEHLNLVNSLVALQSSGSLTLDNVTIGAGTVVDKGAGSVTLSNSQLVMSTANTTVGALDATTGRLAVTSTGLAAYTTISGTLNFELTKDWIDGLVKDANGHFTSIELTFTDVNQAAWDTFKANATQDSLLITGALESSYFGAAVNFGNTAGQVIITTTPPVNIPEPASASLALLGLGSLLMRRRRRQD